MNLTAGLSCTLKAVLNINFLIVYLYDFIELIL